MNIDNWKEFKVGELFDVYLSKDDIQPKHLQEGDTPLISSGKERNGIATYITDDSAKLWDANTLTVDMFGKVFYQNAPYYCVSHGRVNILYPKTKLIEKVLQFIASVIEQVSANKYDFADMCTAGKIKNDVIFLPATPAGSPDWDYMESYMKEMEEKAKERLNRLEEMRKQEKKKIDVSGWGEFKVGELFDATRGKSRRMQILEDGDTPLIAAARNNRGIAGTYNIDAEYENCITVSCNGVGCGSTFYHNYPFSITGDAIVLEEKQDLSDSVKQFIASIIDVAFTNKYSYEEKCSADKAKNETILLPVTSAGTPDWTYMERYMREMEEKAKTRIEKLSVLRI